jgi:SAM-dependent methyltransferase
MSFAHKISKFNREKKWVLFKEYFPFTKERTILDIGFNDIEFSPVTNFLEKNYPYLEKITGLGIVAPKLFLERYPGVKAVQYDGYIFPFKDGEFDLCWSNAVIEHVGNRDKQLLLLKEIKRVGKAAFITTPNKNFPIEVHTRTPLLHFLPEKIFHQYLTLVGKSQFTGDYMNLLSYKNIVSLLKDAGIHDYKIIRNKLSVFTLDFVIIF